MVKVNRINISQVEGGYSDDSDKRPKGEMGLYNDDNDGYDLVIHDGVNSTNLNKVLGKGKFYGHNADSADGSGYDTIKLIPDIPAFNNGSHQYLVIDPTAPNHIHIRAGGTQDNSNSQLIIGGENSFVSVGAGENPDIYIKSNSNNWTFDTDGKIVFPDGNNQRTASHIKHTLNILAPLTPGYSTGNILIDYDSDRLVQRFTIGETVNFMLGNNWIDYTGIESLTTYTTELLLELNVNDENGATVTWDIVDEWYGGDPPNTLATGLHLVKLIRINSSIYGQYLGKTNEFYGEASVIKTEVFNKTGSSIPKFTVVYIDGGQGDHPTIDLADASTESTSSRTYGITAEDIDNMTLGSVVVMGALTGLDTDQFNPTAPSGDVNGVSLWLSPTTPGGVTTTKPSAPDHAVYVGTIVRTHQNEGIVEVRIQNGYELQELHNVAISGVANSDILVYNSGTSLWENTALSSSLISDFDSSVIGVSGLVKSDITGISGASSILNIVQLSQASYDIIVAPDPNTLYIIND